MPDKTYSSSAKVLGIAFRGLRFAFQEKEGSPSFRGLRFAFQEKQGSPSFRGLRFASSPSGGNIAFRGLRFAFEPEVQEITFRGLRFGFEEEPFADTPSLRGVKFSFDPPLTKQISYESGALLQKLDIDDSFDSSANLQKQDIDDSFDSSALLQTINIDKTYDSSALLQAQVDESYDSSALLQAQVDDTFDSSAHLKALDVDETFTSDALLELAGDRPYDSSVLLKKLDIDDSFDSSANLQTQDIDDSFDSSANLQKQDIDDTFDSSANLQKQDIDDTFDSSAVLKANDVDTSFDASMFSQVEPTFLRAFDLPTGYNNITTVKSFTAAQGNADGATSDNPATLFAWIQEDTGPVDKVVGRVDGDGFDDPAATGSTTLSAMTGAEGVKVCYITRSDEWAVVFRIGTEIRYSIWNKTLTSSRVLDGLASTGGSAAVPGTPDDLRIGCTDSGTLVILYGSGYLKLIDTVSLIKTDLTVSNFNASGPTPMVVHPVSGSIDVLYIVGSELRIDRYDSAGSFLGGAIVVATAQSGLDAHHTELLHRYGNDGLIACWSTTESGENVHYRTFADAVSPTFLTPLYARRTVPGTGHISSTGKAFFASIPEYVPTTVGEYTFVIKAVNTVSTDAQCFIWIQVEGPVGSMGAPGVFPDEQVVLLEAARAVPTPPASVSEFEYRHLYDGGSEIAHEVYVHSSVYMGLWRIERDASLFVNTINPGDNDSDAMTTIETIYSGYVGGSKHNNTVGSDKSDYQTERGVDPDLATTFEDLLGAIDEDTVFIGGPMNSEISDVLLSNVLTMQLEELYEIGIANAAFIRTGALTDGFLTGLAAPAIQVTNSNGTFDQNRHVDGLEIVDYAFILRLGVDRLPTQSDKAGSLVAGINRVGTAAAAHALANPVEFRIGQSSGLLVQLRYLAAADPTTLDVTNPSEVTIVTFRLDEVDSSDYDG